MTYFKLAFTGWLQVFFVAINTYFISKQLYVGVTACGFIISLVWSFNVKAVAFGSTKNRIVYACGAALGSLSGAYVSTIIYKLL